MNALEIQKLTKRYDGFTLNDVSLALPEGCVMGLVGENGAGKSTTIALLLGLVRPDEGRVSLLGVQGGSAGFDAARQDVGAVLDEAGFPEGLAAREIGHVMRYTFKRWSDDEYKKYLGRFDVPERKAFKELSRGMKMKLMLAVALSHDARLLILDEATSGLDPVARDEVLDILRDFTRDESRSVLMSSHIVSDLEKICDYVAFLHRGRLVFCEEKDALLDGHALLKCAREDVKRLDPSAVVGTRVSDYGAQVLVKRDLVPGGWPLERAGIEDIMLYYVKGGEVL